MSIARRRLPMRASRSLRSGSLKRPNRQRRQRRHPKPQLRQRKRSADHPVRGGERDASRRLGEKQSMFNQPSPGMAGLLLGLTVMMTVPAAAGALKDEI